MANQLDTAEAKCRYCGSKLETLIEQLTEQFVALEGVPQEADDVIMPALAGLKQVDEGVGGRGGVCVRACVCVRGGGGGGGRRPGGLVVRTSVLGY